MSPVRPITPALRLRDQVYDRIRADLEEGQLAADQRFVEVDLAARYGVSRTPVREALLQLSREGVLERLDRGYAVQTADLKQVLDRLEVRRILDVQIARKAADHASAGQIRAAEVALAKARSAHERGRHREFASAQQQVRDVLREACDNDTLGRCSALVDDSFRFVRTRLFENAQNRRQTIDGLEAVLKAVATGSPDAAGAAATLFVDTLSAFHRKAMGG